MGKHKHKKTFYNDIALRLAHKLFGLDHLHYGFFKKGITPDLKNLAKAQDEYVKNLLSFIPKQVKTILDAGCGTGNVARELIKKKYRVTCLAPDPYLIRKTIENTKGKVETITDLYENIKDAPGSPYDLVLMAESCQYIKIRPGWEQNQIFVKNGGFVLIADFFCIRKLDRPNLSKSGHQLTQFLSAATASQFKLIKKKNITNQVAPTMDIYQDIIRNRAFPVVEALFEFTERKFPLLYGLAKRLFGRKILQLREKYSNQGSKIFKKYKAYYILLLQKSA